MNQLAAVATAAFFLGIGLAGEPLEPLRALVAAVVLAVAAVVLARVASPLVTFTVAFVGVIGTCALQHGAVYPGTGVLALGLGGLAASSFGRKMAPALIAAIGAALGSGLFFIGVPAGY